MKRKFSGRFLLWWMLGILFLAGYLTRLWQPGSFVSRINLIDLGMGLALVMAWWRGTKIRDGLSYWHLAWIAVAAFSLLAGASLFGLSTVAFGYFLRLLIGALFFGVVAGWPIADRFRYIALLGGAVALVGFGQLAILPSISMAMVQKYGFDPHSGRLLALWFDPNIAGGILAITFTVTLALLFSRPARPWLVSTLAILQLVAIVLTQSRSAWIALAVMLGMLLWMLSRRALLILMAGVIILPILSTSVLTRVTGALTVDATSTARFISWQNAWAVVEQAPITGVGYNNYQAASVVAGRLHPRLGQINLAANGSDSSLLTVWATTGLVGLIIFLGLLWEVGWRSRTAEPGWQRAGRRAVLGGMLVNSLFINSLLLSPVWFVLALLWARRLPQPEKTG